MGETDCRKCKSWKGCPGKEWFSYGEIRWCAQQVFWLLKFADYLRVGQYPAPDATCLAVSRKVINTEAAFISAALIIAELDCRLSKTGLKGQLLAEECNNREKMDYLSDEAKDALYYVAGWGRKDRSFSAWLKDRRYYKKSDKDVVKSVA